MSDAAFAQIGGAPALGLHGHGLALAAVRGLRGQSQCLVDIEFLVDRVAQGVDRRAERVEHGLLPAVGLPALLDPLERGVDRRHRENQDWNVERQDQKSEQHAAAPARPSPVPAGPPLRPPATSPARPASFARSRSPPAPCGSPASASRAASPRRTAPQAPPASPDCSDPSPPSAARSGSCRPPSA